MAKKIKAVLPVYVEIVQQSEGDAPSPVRFVAGDKEGVHRRHFDQLEGRIKNRVEW